MITGFDLIIKVLNLLLLLAKYVPFDSPFISTASELICGEVFETLVVLSEILFTIK